MRFQESGIPYRETMSELGRYHNKDLQFKAGKIFGSMCTSPVSIAREVYMLLSRRISGIRDSAQELRNWRKG